MDLQNFISKHKTKIISILGVGGLALGSLIYFNYQEELKIEMEAERARLEQEELNKDIYEDEVLVRALKKIKKMMYPVFHTLHLKADKVKKEIVRREGKLPDQIEKILFTMLTMRGKQLSNFFIENYFPFKSSLYLCPHRPVLPKRKRENHRVRVEGQQP